MSGVASEWADSRNAANLRRFEGEENDLLRFLGEENEIFFVFSSS